MSPTKGETNVPKDYGFREDEPRPQTFLGAFLSRDTEANNLDYVLGALKSSDARDPVRTHFSLAHGRVIRSVTLNLGEDEKGTISVNTAELLDYLPESQEDAPILELEERKTAFSEVFVGLNRRLAQVSTDDLHPEGIEYLALVVRGKS